MMFCYLVAVLFSLNLAFICSALTEIMRNLFMIREKMKLEQDKTQKEADIKIKNGEVLALQKELDAVSNTVKQLEMQKAEAQKRLDELDDKVTNMNTNSVEEIHSVGTVNNVETSYFTQLKICYT